MKRLIWIPAVAAVAAAIVCANVSRGQDRNGSPVDANRPPIAGAAASSPSASASSDPSAFKSTAPIAPAPDLSFEINSCTELDLRRGTPMLLTVRLGNHRAGNARAINAAREALVADAREKLKAGTMTAAESQAREAFAQSREVVPTLVLPPNWPKNVHFEVHQAGNPASQPEWPFSLLAAPAAQPMVLDGTEPATATWGLSPEAAADLATGSWQVVAILDASAATPVGSWQGRVVSEPVRLNIKPPSASVPAEEAEHDNLEVARYHAAVKQWDKSLAAARVAAQLNPDSIGAHILIGDALAGSGDNAGAIKAFQTALTAFRKKHPDAQEMPEYLVERMHDLLLASPPPGLAPEGTIAPPPDQAPADQTPSDQPNQAPEAGSEP
jgi:tetratricopeptide (TPR) repeat protein